MQSSHNLGNETTEPPLLPPYNLLLGTFATFALPTNIDNYVSTYYFNFYL